MRTLHYGLCPPLTTSIIAFLNNECFFVTIEQHDHILINCDACMRGSKFQALPRSHGFHSRLDVLHLVDRKIFIVCIESPTEMMQSVQCFGSSTWIQQRLNASFVVKVRSPPASHAASNLDS